MKHNVLKWFTLVIMMTCQIAIAETMTDIGSLHVQDSGRIKPFDTFARESLRLIYGKTTYNGKPAVDVVMTWMLAPEPWETLELFEVRHSGLRDSLHLSPTRLLFTPRELMSNDRVGLVINELKAERERGDKLNPYYQAVARLENQLSLFLAIKTGEAIRMVPPPVGAASTNWISLADLSGPMRDAFYQLGSTYAHALSGDQQARAKYLQQVAQFKALARSQNPAAYGSDRLIQLEIHLNRFHPFRWAWVSYLVAVLLMALAGAYGARWVVGSGWLVLALAMGFHLYGIVLRCVINGRPPVSNMYETVIWVPFGVVVFSVVLRLIYRVRLATIASSLVAILCLILADVSPTILDASLQPLQPVLRSNFWLSTHVLVITLSYAGFFLAFALGDFVLFYYLRDERRFARQIQVCSQVLYRAIQVGIVLLALGIILGGIWADYSWGRFWGWDPKETWALIALLGYVALLHGRLVGMIRTFGMAVGAVLAFSLVIMAWYGVNFVLGAGLHSYGFGAGGIEYVSGFVGAHVLYVIYVCVLQRSRKKLT